MIRDRGMQALQLLSAGYQETSIDVFVQLPFVFDEEYSRALVKPSVP